MGGLRTPASGYSGHTGFAWIARDCWAVARVSRPHLRHGVVGRTAAATQAATHAY